MSLIVIYFLFSLKIVGDDSAMVDLWGDDIKGLCSRIFILLSCFLVFFLFLISWFNVFVAEKYAAENESNPRKVIYPL